MSAVAASSLVAIMPSEMLRKTDSIKFVLECSNHTLEDKKFWKVRLAGLELLLSLVRRVGNQKMNSADSEQQLVMEAIRECRDNCHFSAMNQTLDLNLSWVNKFHTKNLFTALLAKA
jgi:hypothetical protein